MSEHKVKELAEEYQKFKSMNAEMDLFDHIRSYESLLANIEKAGLSFYDISKYIHRTSVG